MKKLYLALVTALVPTLMYAQGDLDNILKGSANDAKALASGYAQPMLKAFGVGLNQGWYNTAKPHKFPGFDITVTVSQVQIPTAEQFYEVDNTQLNNVLVTTNYDGTAVAANGKAKVPSFFGPDRSPVYNTKPVLTQPFNGPRGSGLKSLPVPIANIGIGLPKGFDLKFRYVPTIDLSDVSGDLTGEFKLFGVGVMHDIKQYIPGIKELPFDLSAFVGYTSMKLDVGFNTSRLDQRGVFESTATTIQGLISKKISVLTVYGGLGYSIAKTTLDIKGNYDLDNIPLTADVPLNFQIDGTASGPRATAGVRLKLAVIAFHADYTLQEFNTLTVGFGINVR